VRRKKAKGNLPRKLENTEEQEIPEFRHRWEELSKE
jgi:hypothetical protein